MNTFWWHLQLAALGDLDGGLGSVAGLRLRLLDLLHHVVALQDLAEDDVSAIEPPVGRGEKAGSCQHTNRLTCPEGSLRGKGKLGLTR